MNPKKPIFFRTPANPWLLTALGVVAAVMAPALFGIAPVGGDPELMYLPIKSELARALADGHLPFWSDRMGLGVPLVAESHSAAFYPPNWLLYRFLELGAAYRLALWLHSVAIVATTYAYVRVLGFGSSAAGFSAMAFALCGFQASHAVHEPFYHAMPFLPACLLLADRFAATGRLAWLAGLAIAWGTQVLLGHFQIQMWTAGLTIVAGGWRATIGRPRGEKARPLRILGLILAIAWGAAIAMVQLRLTWEMKEVSGFDRPAQFLSNYLMPPRHWAQLAMPAVYLGRPRGMGDYWAPLQTTPGEACAYVGIVPLILAFVGWVAVPGDRRMTPWRLLIPLSFGLATMPGWLPDGYALLLKLPGMGLFRAPGRYTLLTSLGLILLAAQGLDRGRSASRWRFWGAIAAAVAFGGLALAQSISTISTASYQAAMGPETIPARLGASAVAWALGLASIVAWRLGRVGAWAPVTVAAVELIGLFYVGPSEWARPIRLSVESPALLRLAEAAKETPGRVAGRLLDVPVLAGLTAAYPSLGIIPPPPNYLLEPAMRPPSRNTNVDSRWQRRFGVTLGIWGLPDYFPGAEEIAVVDDPALDRVMARVAIPNARGPWRLVRYPGAFPPARVANRIRQAAHWGELHSELSVADRIDEACFLAADGVPELPGPFAKRAKVASYDGRTAVVKHDGSCVLILNRTYYPGWTYRIDGGARQPVWKVDGGLHGIPIPGSGTHRVEVVYRPTGFARAAFVSGAALGMAAIVILAAGMVTVRGRREGARSG